MSLADYRKKRDFGTTREPKGRGARKAGSSFVVQKHAARRLHYDLRLEMDGVLKSWAVTRGPSLVPGEKRLAVHVEDHPLDYRNFEGVIPEGQYGAGEVIVWDKGVWIPEGDPHKGYAKGHLDFELRGEKLGGRWHLVRMARKPREKHDNWLLIKSEDAFARAPEDEDILEEMPRSVDTGRTIGDVAEGKPARRSKKAAAPKQAAALRSIKTSAVAPTQAPAADIDPSRLKGAKKAPLP
ncbi:MAG: DNA ligase D, partial [Methylocystaceae bacterium]